MTLGSQVPQASSGRLLIFLTAGTKLKDVDVSPFQPSSVYVAAKDVSYWRPGEAVDIDVDNIAYPAGFSSLQPGNYVVQAVLDVNREYNYAGRSPGDIESAPEALAHWTPGSGGEPRLSLTMTVLHHSGSWLSSS